MNNKTIHLVLANFIFWGTFLGVVHGSMAEGSRSKNEEEVLQVSIEGELVAAKEKGSGTKKSSHSKMAIKVINAVTEEEKELPEFRYKTVGLLPNSKSETLVKEYHEGDILTIQGKLHVDKSLLEVESSKKKQGSGTK